MADSSGDNLSKVGRKRSRPTTPEDADPRRWLTSFREANYTENDAKRSLDDFDMDQPADLSVKKEYNNDSPSMNKCMDLSEGPQSAESSSRSSRAHQDENVSPENDVIVLSDEEAPRMNGHVNGCTVNSCSDDDLPLPSSELREMTQEELQEREKLVRRLRSQLRNEEMKLVLLKKLKQSQQMKESLAIGQNASKGTNLSGRNMPPTNIPPPLVRGGMNQSSKQLSHHQSQQHLMMPPLGPPPLVMAPRVTSSSSTTLPANVMLQQSMIRGSGIMGRLPMNTPPNMVLGYPIQGQSQSSLLQSNNSSGNQSGNQNQGLSLERLDNQTPAQRQAAAKLALRKQLEKTLLQIPPPKPPPPEMHFIPNPSNTEFIYLVGLEVIVNFIIDDKKLDEPPKPFECVQCGTDFTPVWKWDNINKQTVICEQCVTSNIKKALKAEHTNRLKTAFVKALQQEQEIEQSMAQVSNSPPQRDATSNSVPTQLAKLAAEPQLRQSAAANLSLAHQQMLRLPQHQPLPAHMLSFSPLLSQGYPYQVLGKTPVSSPDLQRQYLLDMIPPRSLAQGAINWKTCRRPLRVAMATGGKKPLNKLQHDIKWKNFLVDVDLSCRMVLNRINLVTQDQALFQKQVSDHLQQNPNEAKQIAEEFVNYVEEKKFLFFSLYTTTTVDSSNARCTNQDSLVHLLLGIPHLQQLITEVLFEKIAELSGFDESFPWQGTNYSLTFLVVKQFKFINNVVYSKELCDKILEILDVVTEETQQNIINSFPEILNDAYHSTVAKTLSGYLNKSSPLTISILETLGSLNIPPDILSEINDSTALSTAWMKCEYLPVIIRFLYNTCDEENIENITRTVRNNLAESGFNKQMQHTETGQQNHVIIILDQLKFFIQIRKSVGDAWIKVIESNTCADTQIVDFFALLIFFSMPSRQLAASNLLRHKIQSANFTHRLILTILKEFSWALKDYFDPIMQIAEWSLKQTSDKVIQFGRYLYKYSFGAFDDAFRQEIIEHLLSHFSSCKCSEVDSAIAVLTDLIKKQPTVMASFAIYIKRVIDRLDQLTFQQLKLVYECLSMLACSGTPEGETMQHDLQLIIQKQITNKELKYKRFGIVGALTFLANLASPDVGREETQRAKSLLELVLEGIKSEKLAMALLYDELSLLIAKRQINPDIENWIHQNIISTFQDIFVVDDDRKISDTFSYGLDDDEADGIIGIDLLTLIEKDLKIDTGSSSTLLLCPQFRLFRIYESVHENGSLGAIDALLGCALRLCPMNQKDDFQTLTISEKDTVCHVLFYAINWFRELVNAFATQTDTEYESKVLTRVKNIVYFEDVLRKCLTNHSKFVPPLAQFDTDEKSTDLKRKRESASTEKSKKKAKKDLSNSDTTITQESGTTQPTTKVTKKSKAKPKAQKEKEAVLISLAMYQHCFRKLDFEVFRLLNVKLHFKDSENILTPAELIFLLEDLKSKFEISLRPRTRRAFGAAQNMPSPSNSSDVFRQSVDLIPHLCSHLETTYGYFQENLCGSQDMIDAARSELCESIALTFHLLLECLTIIFNWHDVDTEEFEETREKAVVLVSRRLSSLRGGSQLSFEDHVVRALDYVIKFGNSLPTFACASGILSLATSLWKVNKIKSHHTKIGNLAVDFLKQPWFDREGNSERGLRHNECLQQILTIALQMNSDPIKLLQDFVTVAFSELLAAEEESKSYRTLNKFSFATYYRVLFLSLVKEMKQISTQEKGAAILRWRLCVEIFLILVNAVKVYKSQTCILTCLKCSRSFVENFVKLGIPVLETGFKQHKDDVIGLLRSFQTGTRFVQHLCCHAKNVKQLATAKHIPPLRKNLEALLYRVKAMLALHNCRDAFWLGNLKNKDIRGEEIRVDADAGDDESVQETDEAPDDVPEELQGSENSGNEDEDDNASVYSQSF
uniref:Transcriptional repressor p66 coiled-coil MBD2-interaction domain-containing protein n=1 Tax=Strigamia maritima TaxID=126957 RepID=T1JPF9_STRMM